MRGERRRLPSALLLSVLIHILLLSLIFGGEGLSVPGLAFPWRERPIESDLRIVLLPSPTPTAALAPPSPGTAAATVSPAGPRAEATRKRNTSPDAPSANAPAQIRELATIDVALSDEPTTLLPAAPAAPTWAVALAPSASSPQTVIPSPPDVGEVAHERIGPSVHERVDEGTGLFDAERDAERQRDRLEAARVEATRLEAERQEVARQVVARLEAERQAAARQEAARVEAERLEAERGEAGRRAAAQQEAERQEAARQKAAGVEAARQAAARQEVERQEAERQGAARVKAERLGAELLEAERQEAARQEAAREARQAAARLQAERQEAARQQLAAVEAARQVAARQEEKRQEAARQEAARGEAERLEAEREKTARRAEAQLEAERQERARQAAVRVEAARLEGERQEAVRQAAARQEAARLAEQEETTRHEAARRAMGRQLDEEAAQRAAALTATRPPSALPYSWTTARRIRLWGLTDPNVELIRYAEAWTRKIQFNTAVDVVREIAKRPHANPVVTVAVRSDGSVESVTFEALSGVAEIDNEIRRIVQSQEHYEAFPPALASQYDVIEIRRTWYFDVGIRLY